MKASSAHDDRDRAELSAADFDALLARALTEWNAGIGVPALDSIRTRGSLAQYQHAVNVLVEHDEQLRERDARLGGIVDRSPPARGD